MINIIRTISNSNPIQSNKLDSTKNKKQKQNKTTEKLKTRCWFFFRSENTKRKQKKKSCATLKFAPQMRRGGE